MNKSIYPAEWAALNVAHAGAKYRPGNGTEGAIFIETWCGSCARDKSAREGMLLLDECDDNEVCSIIGRTFAHQVDSSDYPGEWQYGEDGQPRCTAFVQAGDPIPAPRCEHTVDLFRDKVEES